MHEAIRSMVSLVPVVLMAMLTVTLTVAAKDASSHPAMKYEINLDTRPEERWTKIATKYAMGIKGIISQVESSMPSSVMEVIKGIDLDIVNDFPYPYGAELLGMAKALNISTMDVFFINVIYEFSSFATNFKACTSIVAQTLNGTIYHTRNLDFNYADILRNMTIEVDFIENGKVSYTGTTFAGYIGLLTGQKPHHFSVTLNQRYKGAWWMNLLQALATGTHGCASLLIRDVLSNPLMDFKSAVNALSNTPLIASSYIIVAGVNPNEGVVISRGRPRATDMWWLGSNHTWFLVETNYDHWEDTPIYDNRRQQASNAMREMGQANITVSALWEVMAVPLVQNSGTIYTVVMSPNKPEVYATRVIN